MKILVVDDEKLLVKGIKFNLENEGYDVDVCYDGATAVQMAAQGGYDLIILDLMMPGLDGLEACQRIRQTRHIPERPRQKFAHRGRLVGRVRLCKPDDVLHHAPSLR